MEKLLSLIDGASFLHTINDEHRT